MLYEIQISGGFAGTVQKFKGKVALNEQKEKALKNIFDNATLHNSDKDMRDAFEYMFKLEMDDKVYQATFDDATIPIDLLTLLNEIKVR